MEVTFESKSEVFVASLRPNCTFSQPFRLILVNPVQWGIMGSSVFSTHVKNIISNASRKLPSVTCLLVFHRI